MSAAPEAATPWNVEILPPSPRLADDVLFYVARRRAAGDAQAPGVSPVMRFPANMYSALTIVHSGHLTDPASGRRTPGIALSGAMSRPVLRQYVDAPETTVVVFKPGRLADFCRERAAHFTDSWIDASGVLPVADHIEMAEGMTLQPTIARQVMVLEQVLQRRFALVHDSAARQLSRTMQSLLWQPPWPKVSELAAQLGWGTRMLERRFADTFGVSPQMLIRLARLQWTLLKMQRRDPGMEPGLAGLAKAAGYADHAHMSREVRAFVGITPTAVHRLLRARLGGEWVFSVQQEVAMPASACDEKEMKTAAIA